MLLCAVVAVLFTTTQAQAQGIAIFADPAGTDNVVGTTTGLVPVYIIANPGPLDGLTAVQFMAAIPDCWTGTVHLGDLWDFPTVIGNSQTGVSIGFGGCYTDPVYVGTINLFSSIIPTDCCHYTVDPDPLALTGQVEYVDCSATKFTADGGPVAWVGTLIGETSIIDMFPPDGAAAQPLDTDISWTVSTCCITGVSYKAVHFGTTTDPPMVAWGDPANSYDPGPLMPGTTYYWRMSIAYGFCPGGESGTPLMSFTTEESVPVNHSTWGAIKALYH
jgi:hypothetical protein